MDPVTILGLVAFCVSSSTSLYKTIDSLKSRKQDVRNLKNEVGNLNVVLQAVAKNIEDATDDFEVLRLILQQCHQACQDFEKTVLDTVRQSHGRLDEFKAWAKIQYLGSDIDNFRKLIGSYKVTLTIALANSNLRTSKITKQLLETYTEMTKDAKDDLEDQIANLTDKLKLYQNQPSPASSSSEPTTAKQTLGQKIGLEQCITVCQQLLRHVAELQPTVTADMATSAIGADGSPSGDRVDILAPRLTVDALRLCTHSLDTVTRHLEDLREANGIPDKADAQRIAEQLTSAQKSLEIIASAQQQRVNVFENIDTGEGSFQTVVSTIGDLIRANGITIGAQSTNIMGQMNDESLQKMTYNLRPDFAERSTERATRATFENRHGFGHTMHRGKA